MAKKQRQCSNCAFWKGSQIDKNLCSNIRVGEDVFISGRYLLTSFKFGCNRFKEKEVVNDTVSSGDDSDSTND